MLTISFKLWGDLGVVRLFVDAHFFEETAAEAMGVDREQPITITVTFAEGYLENDFVRSGTTFLLPFRRSYSLAYILALQIPKIEVKQSPRFVLEFQLTQIAKRFLNARVLLLPTFLRMSFLKEFSSPTHHLGKLAKA